MRARSMKMHDIVALSLQNSAKPYRGGEIERDRILVRRERTGGAEPIAAACGSCALALVALDRDE